MARPREFDEDAVLDIIADLFWRRGFESVSLRDIAEASGVKMASIYAAYCDKKGLYRAALDHYRRAVVEPAIAMVAGPGAPRERIAKLLQMAIDAARRGDRRGCFLCNAAIDRAGDDAEAAEFVTATLKRIEDSIAAALKDDPPYDKNPAARRRAAQHILADYLGMRVLARSGAPLAVLKNVRESALASL